MMDSQRHTSFLIDGYEILVMGGNCSTAWVPYTAGDPIPTGAVVAGKDNLAGRYHYVVASMDTAYKNLATYAHGTDQAFYRHSRGEIMSFTDMYALVALT